MVAFAKRIKSFNISNFNTLLLCHEISETILNFMSKINDE